jgi:predicted AAA+ superfamily ATPase
VPAVRIALEAVVGESGTVADNPVDMAVVIIAVWERDSQIARMVARDHLLQSLQHGLQRSPAVALLGPRQTGKTTLAHSFAKFQSARFFDLEDPADRVALQNPMLTLRPLRGLVVLDEVQRAPELFPALRVLLDRPEIPARFLLLGSASPHLVKGVTETLAGRVAFLEMQGFHLDEVGEGALAALWEKGGFPQILSGR